MIELRMINDTHIVLNSDLIEYMESTPDTVISLTNGKKIMVKESVSDVVDQIVRYRRRIGIVAKEILDVNEAPPPRDAHNGHENEHRHSL